MQATIYNNEGKKKGMVDLPDAIFDLPWNAALVRQVVDAEQENARAGTAHTKGRGEVAGGGKKPWRQKGTGRARHGSIRSPIWIGGGVTHGPRAERLYSQKINKRVKRKALYTALSAKARDGEVIIVESISFPEAKTRHAAVLFQNLAKEGITGIGTRKGKALVLFDSYNPLSVRTVRNLPYVASCEARNVYTTLLLSAKYAIIPEAALSVLEQSTNKK